MTPANPTTPSERIVALDVLRGFALYGVFLTNAYVSARPMEAAMSPPAPGSGGADVLAWMLFDGLLVMKFVALFSVLFGIGLVLQAERAEAKGLRFGRLYLKRLGVLAVFGVLHGCLLFEGDILLVYSLVGLVLFWFRRCSAATLVKVGAAPLVVGIGLSLLWVALGEDSWGEKLSEFDARADEARRSGGIADLLAVRPVEFVSWLAVSSFVSFNWRVVALFFFGAAVMKAGWTRAEHGALQRKVAVIGLVAGGMLELGAAAAAYWAAPGPTGLRLGLALADETASLLLSAGYFCGVLVAVHSGWCRALQAGLAAVGRLALTNYILQSVVMNVVFFGFGFGMFDRISRVGVLGLMSALFGLQVALSVLWLLRFEQGPLEWLWRRLTYPRRTGEG